MYHIGFTGTRKGLDHQQKFSVRHLLNDYKSGVFHHGDCFGADAEAHEIAKKLGMKIIIHPPIDESNRAFCDGDKILPPQDYLARNQAIVKASSFLIACPYGPEEVRSGTWSTVRYAGVVEIQTVILYRNKSFPAPKGS